MKTIRSKIAGTSFDDRNKTIQKHCTVGLQLLLEREHNNQHDKDAIKVLVKTYRGPQQIGYITRTAAKTVAPQMDSGENIIATITEILGGTKSKPNYGVNIEISTGKASRNLGSIALISLIALIGMVVLNTNNTPPPPDQAKIKAVEEVAKPNKPKAIIEQGWELTYTTDQATGDKLDAVSKQAVTENPTANTPSLTIFCRKNNYTLFINWHQNLPKTLNGRTVLDGNEIPNFWQRSQNTYSQYTGNTPLLIDKLTRSNIIAVSQVDNHASFNLKGLYSALLKANPACLDQPYAKTERQP